MEGNYEPHYGSLRSSYDSPLTTSQKLAISTKQQRLIEILRLLQDVEAEAPALSPEAVSKLQLAVERLRKTIVAASMGSPLDTPGQPIPYPNDSLSPQSEEENDFDQPPSLPPPPPPDWDDDDFLAPFGDGEINSIGRMSIGIAGSMVTRAATASERPAPTARYTPGDKWDHELKILRSRLDVEGCTDSDGEGSPLSESLYSNKGSETEDDNDNEEWGTNVGRRLRSKNVETPLMRVRSNSLVLAYRSRVEVEIIESEEVYIATLRLLNGHYITPIIDSATTMNIFKDSHDRDTIIALRNNLISLIDMNSILLDRLIIRQSTPRQNRRPDEGIGRIFLELAPKMIIYGDYHYRHNETMDCLEQLMAAPAIAELVNRTRESLARKRAHTDANCDMWNMLITPVQRIPRYQLLLQELLKYTPSGDQDACNIKLALAKLKSIAEEIDSAAGDVRKKLREIQESMSGDVINLLDTYREFVMEGPLTATIDPPRSREYQFFFFSDIIIYASKKKLAIVNPLGRKPALNYKGFFILSNLAYQDLPDQPDKQVENAFTLVCLDSDGTGTCKRIQLVAKTSDEKKLWLKHLAQYIPLWEETAQPNLTETHSSISLQRKLTGMRNRDESPYGDATCKNKSLNVQGFMNKRGEINKAWKRRYFKLFRSELLYFEGPSMMKLRGRILLGSYTLQLSTDCKTKLPFCLKLQPVAKGGAGARSYFLEPETTQQLYYWVRALRHCVARVDEKVREWQREAVKTQAVSKAERNISS